MRLFWGYKEPPSFSSGEQLGQRFAERASQPHLRSSGGGLTRAAARGYALVDVLSSSLTCIVARHSVSTVSSLPYRHSLSLSLQQNLVSPRTIQLSSARLFGKGNIQIFRLSLTNSLASEDIVFLFLEQPRTAVTLSVKKYEIALRQSKYNEQASRMHFSRDLSLRGSPA